MAKRGAAMLEEPEAGYAPEAGARRGPRVRRDPVEDFAGGYAEPSRAKAVAKAGGVRVKLGRRVPTSVIGLVAAGCALAMVAGCAVWLLLVVRTFLLTDARFNLAGPASVEVEGNRQITRGQVLRVFADDLERNIFRLSLDGRQAELEAMPWVERATVMRLLPGRIRVALTERVPVAFVREGSHVGLVDAHGVLLEMPAGGARYSFPVVTGIAAADPVSVRAARMRLYEQFVGELDGGGARNTESLSEVDLSNPEDVRAVIEEHAVHVLVHFGDGEFLPRFQKVKELLPQWHAQYPNLQSADIRYEHEIPLSMAAPVVAKAEPVAKLPAAPVTRVKKPVAVVVHAKPPVVAPKPLSVPPAPKGSAPANGPEPVPAPKFVPPPVAKPWQPAPVASAPKGVTPSAASVSASARAAFAAKPVTATPKPVAAAPKPPTALPKPVAVAPRSLVPLAKPAPAPPKGAKGKPSAGHALAPSDPNFPAQGLRP